MNTEQERFLREELLTLTINGALGRSRTYSKFASAEDKKKLKKKLLEDLRQELREIAKQYKTPVAERTHISNIQKLANALSSKYPAILTDGRFRIGVAQKALNLYLKYLWCAGLAPVPPHCPFDRRIIEKLLGCSGLNWTYLDKIDDYEDLVRQARKIAGSMSLSEWELKVWNN